MADDLMQDIARSIERYDWHDSPMMVQMLSGRVWNYDPTIKPAYPSGWIILGNIFKKDMGKKKFNLCRWLFAERRINYPQQTITSEGAIVGDLLYQPAMGLHYEVVSKLNNECVLDVFRLKPSRWEEFKSKHFFVRRLAYGVRSFMEYYDGIEDEDGDDD